ncbi:MAG: ABC transporter permease [Anaerolineales bacterium]
MIHKLWAMIRNEFLREFAYPLSLLFFIVLPVIFTAAVGTGLGGRGAGDETPQEFGTPLYVVSADEGPLVTTFLDALDETNLQPELVGTLPEESFGLEIPAAFSEDLLNGEAVTITLHTRPTTSASLAVEQYVQAAVSRLGGAALIAEMGVTQILGSESDGTEEERRDLYRSLVEETLAASAEPFATAEVAWATGTELTAVSRDFPTAAEQASAGQIVTWVQITLLGAAEVLVSERLGGTLRRLLVAPAGRATVLGGKLLARLVLGLVQMTVLFLSGAFLFGVNWGQDPLAVAAVSVAFALATVGLGMLVATFVRTRGQASSVVVGLSMALAALGGAWYPLEVTPPLYRQLVQILPSTWAMRAYTDVLVRNASLADILPHVGVLLLFALVFTLLGVLRFGRYE